MKISKKTYLKTLCGGVGVLVILLIAFLIWDYAEAKQGRGYIMPNWIEPDEQVINDQHLENARNLQKWIFTAVNDEYQGIIDEENADREIVENAKRDADVSEAEVEEIDEEDEVEVAQTNGTDSSGNTDDSTSDNNDSSPDQNADSSDEDSSSTDSDESAPPASEPEPEEPASEPESEPETNPIDTLAVLGSSSAAGAGASSTAASLAGVLQSCLGSHFGTSMSLHNYARGGASIADLNANGVPQAAAVDPEIVVMLTFKDNVTDRDPSLVGSDYSQFGSYMTNNSNAEIFIGMLTIPDEYAEEYGEADVMRMAALLSNLYSAAAGYPRMHVIPIPAVEVSHPEYFEGGHPNDAGHAYLGGYLCSGVRSAM